MMPEHAIEYILEKALQKSVLYIKQTTIFPFKRWVVMSCAYNFKDPGIVTNFVLVPFWIKSVSHEFFRPANRLDLHRIFCKICT